MNPLDRIQSALLGALNTVLAAPITTELAQRANDARMKVLEVEDQVLTGLNLPTAAEHSVLQGRVRATTQRLDDAEERLDELTVRVRSLWATVHETPTRSETSKDLPHA
ncbi:MULTISPECIES: hypothetical protein [unclassified Nocardia]|uniref:hypothetical protein n=1 Tax=unclassified Nocardia TaxID=2637762 RepID=UPI0033A32C01